MKEGSLGFSSEENMSRFEKECLGFIFKIESIFIMAALSANKPIISDVVNLVRTSSLRKTEEGAGLPMKLERELSGMSDDYYVYKVLDDAIAAHSSRRKEQQKEQENQQETQATHKKGMLLFYQNVFVFVFVLDFVFF
jgi:hypothetical protein